MTGHRRAWVIGLLLCWPAAAAGAGAACEKSFAEVAGALAPSVVMISAVTVDPFRLDQRITPSVGAGVVVDDSGLVLTNAHVVYGSNAIYVTVGDSMMVPARMVGADPIVDLAVIALPPIGEAYAPATLGDSDSLEIGQDVLAIGNSFGLSGTVTRGIVSGLDRVLPRTPMSWMLRFIQTDAAINPGDSGGPLVDRCGAVVGINAGTMANAENLGFAVPANVAKEVLPSLIENGRVIRPWHGVFGKLVSVQLRMLINVPLVTGFLVETVEPGSPAENLGLRPGSLPVSIGAEEYLLGGDIITRVDGIPLTDMATVAQIVRSHKVGDTVKLEYFRDGAILTGEVVLPERPILPGDLPSRRNARLDRW